ncbi:MAG: 4Fe-4S dicluster domain-containing protein, partial [Candidatus Hydrothermarchaeaceae archaeon]
METKIEDFVKGCYQCGICSGACPKARVKGGFLPRRMVYDVITGRASRTISSGYAWDCMTCRQCTMKCPMKVDFMDMIKK